MATNNSIGLKDSGLASYDGDGTFAGRTVTAGSSKLSVSNGDGISGDPTVDAVEANFTHDNIGGTLGIAKGGTGQTTATEAFDALAPTTTKGDVIVSNGSDNVRVAVGTNDQVLTADSSEASGVKWADAGGGGGLVYITSLTASNDATLDFENKFSSTYDNYLFVFNNILPATDGADLQIRMGTGAGPTYITSNDYWHAAVDGADAQTSYGRISDAVASSTNAHGVSGYMYLYDAYSSSVYKHYTSFSNYYYQFQANFKSRGGTCATTSTLTGLRFFFSSGNVTSGTIRLYGIVNS